MDWTDFCTGVLVVAVLCAGAYIKAYDATWIRRGAAWGERKGALWAARRRARRHRSTRRTNPETSIETTPEDQP